MAKFKVYGEKEVNTEVLAQLRTKEGRLNIFLVDEKGKKISGGHIIRIDNRGLHLMNNCSEDVGLPLDCEGRIMVY